MKKEPKKRDPKKPRKKPSEQHKKELLRKRCVKLAKDIAKTKVGYRCEYEGCFRSRANGFQMHGSHIYGENSNKSMSADPENIICLCAVHHTGGFWKNAKDPSWHENPVVMVDWAKAKWPERFERLKERANITIVCHLDYWQKKLEELIEKIPEALTE